MMMVTKTKMWGGMTTHALFSVKHKEAFAKIQAATGIDDIDVLVPHQANMRINQFVANQLNIPEEKLLHNIQKYGNTTAGTIPILLAEAEREGRLKPGTKLATAAFGSGFTWGSAIIDW